MTTLLCRLWHRWGRWAEPFTPEGCRETIIVQRRRCHRCGKVGQHVLGT